MRDLVILFVHVIATLARLPGPGGIRSVVAESVPIKQGNQTIGRAQIGRPLTGPIEDQEFFVDWDTEKPRHLLSKSRTAPHGIAPFGLDNGFDEFSGRSLWTRTLSVEVASVRAFRLPRIRNRAGALAPS